MNCCKLNNGCSKSLQSGLICTVYKDPTVLPWVRNNTQCPFNQVIEISSKRVRNPLKQSKRSRRG